MSTAPAGWTTPKTDWATDDAPNETHFNNFEGNTLATETGDRTVDETQAAVSDVGTLREFLDWFAHQIGLIVGKTNWYDAPSNSLDDIKELDFSGCCGPGTYVATTKTLVLQKLTISVPAQKSLVVRRAMYRNNSAHSTAAVFVAKTLVLIIYDNSTGAFTEGDILTNNTGAGTAEILDAAGGGGNYVFCRLLSGSFANDDQIGDEHGVTADVNGAPTLYAGVPYAMWYGASNKGDESPTSGNVVVENSGVAAADYDVSVGMLNITNPYGSDPVPTSGDGWRITLDFEDYVPTTTAGA